MSSSVDPIFWAHCNSCARQTKHSELTSHTAQDDVVMGDSHLEVTTIYQLLECRGCGTVVFKVQENFPQLDLAEDPKYYPPRISRRLPKWRMALPKGWIGLLNEVYSALHSNSRRLAMMGARALVDVYMNDTVSDVGGFEQKLKALVVQGHISANDKDVLAAALEEVRS
ncbi:hypothetical protein D3C84_353230 [compost metagenome]